MAAAPQTQLSYNGLWKAWVAIDGKPVEEKPELKKTTCYIEARDDCVFTVHILDDLTYLATDWTRSLYVDGKHMTDFYLTKNSKGLRQPGGDPTRIISFTGRPDSAPFLFSKPILTDNADIACKDEAIVKNLGTIQVRLWRVTVEATAVPSSFAPAKDTVLHERAKKATLSHQAKFGVSKAIPPITTSRASYIDPQDSPYWTFEFRYLSCNLLEIRNIAEAKPQVAASAFPPPAGSSTAKRGKKRQSMTITLSSDDDESAGEDSKEELKRLRSKIAKLEGVKEEGGSKKKVKKENGAAVVIEIDD